MPANMSAAHQLVMGPHPATRLVSVSGASDLATPRDVELQAAAEGTARQAVAISDRRRGHHPSTGISRG